MRHETEFQAADKVNPEATQANLNNGHAEGYAHNIGSTRPACPLQNPYYNTPVNNPQMNLSGQNPYIQTAANSMPNNAPNNIPGNTPASSQPKNGFDTGDFVKGALIGAAVTYLMTNKNVQDALFKTVAKTSSLFQAGMEEVKERFEDAKAEVQAENQVD